MNIARVTSVPALVTIGLLMSGCDGSAAVPDSDPAPKGEATPASDELLERHQRDCDKVVVYSSEREVLKQYRLDLDEGALALESSVTLPFQVQYVTPNATLRQLYVGSSDGATNHRLVAFDIDGTTGALTPKGMPIVPSGGRIIHLSIDPAGRYLAMAHNVTTRATVAELGPDGSIVREVPQTPLALTAFFPHQAKFDDSGRTVLVPGLGAAATATAPEQPGSLTTFAFADGQLTQKSVITYGTGLGARHLDFHPRLPLAYVAMERGNRLYAYQYGDGSIGSAPLFDTTTLLEPDNVRTRQRAGAIHVHPNGRFLYLSNRADATVAGSPAPGTFIGGENSIAVFRLHPRTGKPTLIQHAPTQGFEARTFTIDPTGGHLIVANQSTRNVAGADGAVVTIPRSLTVFRIRPDGRLEFRRKYDLGASDAFWIGSYRLPG